MSLMASASIACRRTLDGQSLATMCSLRPWSSAASAAYSRTRRTTGYDSCTQPAPLMSYVTAVHG